MRLSPVLLAVFSAFLLYTCRLHVPGVCIPISHVYRNAYNARRCGYALRAKTREGDIRGEADASVIIPLLREPERSMYLSLIKHGGETPVVTVARELGLNKVRAWRAAQRLEEKDLVILEKAAVG
jgi:hypothetical protein